MNGNPLDLFVDSGLTVIGVLVASERGLRESRHEHELLLQLLKGLEHDPRQRLAVRTALGRENHQPMSSSTLGSRGGPKGAQERESRCSSEGHCCWSRERERERMGRVVVMRKQGKWEGFIGEDGACGGGETL